MNDLNSVLVEGRLTKEPNRGLTRSGKDFCLFTVANNSYYKPEGSEEWIQKTVFIDVSLFGRNAVNFDGVKGTHVRLVGVLTMDDMNKIRLLANHYEVKIRQIA